MTHKIWIHRIWTRVPSKGPHLLPGPWTHICHLTLDPPQGGSICTGVWGWASFSGLTGTKIHECRPGVRWWGVKSWMGHMFQAHAADSTMEETDAWANIHSTLIRAARHMGSTWPLWGEWGDSNTGKVKALDSTLVNTPSHFQSTRFSQAHSLPILPQRLYRPNPSPSAIMTGQSNDPNQPTEPLSRTFCWYCYGDAHCLHLKPELVGDHLCHHFGSLPKDEACREDSTAMRWERPGPGIAWAPGCRKHATSWFYESINSLFL